MNSLTPAQEAAINQLKEGAEYENLFFSKAKDPALFARLRADGWFSPSRNPAPSEDREGTAVLDWPALLYLEKIADQGDDPEHLELAKTVLEILREVTYASPRVDNPRTWWRFARIFSRLPTCVLSLEDLEMPRVWLSSRFGGMMVGHTLADPLMKKLLAGSRQEEWPKALKLAEVVTTLRENAGADGEDVTLTTLLKEDDLARSFGEHWLTLGKRCGHASAVLFETRLRQVTDQDHGDNLSHVWRPAIEEHEQNHQDDTARAVLTNAFRDALLGFAQEGHAEAALRDYLSSDQYLLKRVAVHVLGECYATYREVFWSALNPNWFCLEMLHELFELIHLHFRSFNAEQQEHLLSLVESLREDVPDSEERPRYVSLWRLRWLEAMQGQGNRRADELHKHYWEMVGGRPDHPSFSTYMEFFSGSVAPLTPDQVLSMDVRSIVEYVRAFVETGGLRAPSADGLAESIQNAVRGNPEHFTKELRAFLACGSRYQLAVLRGLGEAWKDKRSMSWEEIIPFCQALVGNTAFWTSAEVFSESGLTPSRDWVVSAISDLIIAGTEDDGRAMPDKLLIDVGQILRVLLERQRSTMEDKEDLMFHALNTPRGRVLQAFYSHTLRRVRLCDQRKEDRTKLWEEVIPTFELELGKCQGVNLEFSVYAGRYLPSLYYLSKAWVAENIDRVFPIQFEVNWRCAMEGFLHVPSFYGELYDLLKARGHLHRAFTAVSREAGIRRTVIQIIGLAYVLGKDRLDDENGLIGMLIKEGTVDDIAELAHFFWGDREGMLRNAATAEKRRQSVIAFWRECHARGPQLTPEEKTQLHSDLASLAAFLPSVSEESKIWLREAALVVDDHYAMYFVEELDRLADSDVQEVSDLFLVVVRRLAPTYPPDHLRSLLAKIRQSHPGGYDQICREYALKNMPSFCEGLG